MASLTSDIIGRVRRLPVRPSERGALLPLMEAIHNSVFSITEQFGDSAVKKGLIEIRIVRNEQDEDKAVIGFDVEDNGVGFTNKNYEAFLTPDSRLKENRGGKGVGRLSWLKVFQSISVDSVFTDGSKTNRRRFNFRLTDKDQVEEIDLIENEKGPRRTKISFRDFDSAFAGKCPAKLDTISSRIISHFVPLFVAGNAPKVKIIDDRIIDAEESFASHIVDQQTDDLQLQLGGEDVSLKLWSLKCDKKARFNAGGFNFAFLTGDNRSVIEYCVDEQLGLKALDGEHVYIGCVSGDYLNQHINGERTAFTFEPTEIDEIKKAVARKAREYLKSNIDSVLAQKLESTRKIIEENPQFLFALGELNQFVERLAPNATKREDIFLELSRLRLRRMTHFSTVKTRIDQNPQIDDQVKQRIVEYQKFLRDEKEGLLAEYVIKRKAVLDLFERFLEYKIDGELADDDTRAKLAYEREEAIHHLICPMKVDSNQLALEDHNLWLLDDRLAFFNYFASDTELKKYANSDSAKRPDLVFLYDACVAWRAQKNSDTIIIVEFKRPMRKDYNGEDPVQQVLRYVKKLKNDKNAVDLSGRPIGNLAKDAAFHCYIVADITTQLEDEVIGRFHLTPDGNGYFGYSQNPAAFVEIIPYDKLLRDARLRNTIFFHKLGITNNGE